MESYLYTHEEAETPKRKKRKQVNLYDPNASDSDKRYTEHYGL